MATNLDYFKLWDYFVLSIKVTPNHRVPLIELLCKFTSKDYFYLKSKFQENMNKYKCFIYRNAGKVWILKLKKNPWKSIQVTPFYVTKYGCTLIQNGNYQEINFLTFRFSVGNLPKINQNQKIIWDYNSSFTHSIYMK